MQNRLAMYATPGIEPTNILGQYAQGAPLLESSPGPWRQGNGRQSLNVRDTTEWYSKGSPLERALFNLNAHVAYGIGNKLIRRVNDMKWLGDVFTGRGPQYFQEQASNILHDFANGEVTRRPPLDVTVYPPGDPRNGGR